MKQKWILIVVVVAGLLAFIPAALILTHYIQSVRAERAKHTEVIEVIAAADNLTQGTELKFDDIGTLKIYRTSGKHSKDYVEKQDKDQILGRKLRYSVEKRQPILWADVEMPEGILNAPQPAGQTGAKL